MWLPATQVPVSASEPRQRSTALHMENCFLPVSWVCLFSCTELCCFLCSATSGVTSRLLWVVLRCCLPWSISCNQRVLLMCTELMELFLQLGQFEERFCYLGQIVCKWCGLNDEAKRLASAMCLSKKCRWTMLVLGFWQMARSGARNTPSSKEKGQRNYSKLLQCASFKSETVCFAKTC